VSGALADAVELGLVASYAHPGGNVTGITPYLPDLPAKQMEVAHDLLPHAKSIGLFGNLNDQKAIPQHKELIIAAKKLGIEVVSPEIRVVDDMEPAVERLSREKVDAVIVLQTTMTLSRRQQLAALFAKFRLPAIYGYREHAEEGGLLSYGVDLGWCWRRLATYVHKILHGAATADLPVEFPPKIQLVVNLRTAKALGLEIPPLLLARADELIE
jgi:putative ABC transport system substrate-binding protein